MQIDEMAVSKVVNVFNNLQDSDPDNYIFKNAELYSFFIYLQMLLSCQYSSNNYRIAYQDYLQNKDNDFYKQLYVEAKEAHEKNKNLKDIIFNKFITGVVE